MCNHLSATEYLNYENGKFSKSRGIGVFGNQAEEVGVSPSVWRYYLMANRPESGDTQFEWSAFAAANNSELLANFGNFVNRIVKFVNAKCDGTIPEFSATYKDESFDFPAWIAKVNTLLWEYIDLMEHVHLRAGIRKLMEISAEGNNLLQYRLDNTNLAENPERTHTVIGLALNLCSLLASIAAPYMPSTSEAICQQLNTKLEFIPDTWTPDTLKGGHKIGKAAYLFSRIEDKKLAEWKDKFGGTAESRAAEEAAKKKKQEEKEKKKAKKAAKTAEAAKAKVEGAAHKIVDAVKPGKSSGGDGTAPSTGEVSHEVTNAEGGMTTTSSEVTKDLPIRGKPT